jgi:predicted CXXCH cytochrome family protein
MRANYLAALSLVFYLIAATTGAETTCETTACHPPAKWSKHLHSPVKEGECSVCHEGNAAGHPQKGKKTFRLTSEGANLCTMCHQAFTGKKMMHSPVAGGKCLTCHNPHGSDGAKLLASDDLTTLCTSCHDNTAFSRHEIHGPTAVGACTTCHEPHHSNERALLRSHGASLCFTCHSDFQTELSRQQVIHGPLGGDSCEDCHNPHSSENPHLLKKPMPELCNTCHSKIAKLVSSADNDHAPTKTENGCATCHSPHFSQYKNLLIDNQQKICLTCHGGTGEKPSGLRNISREIEKGKKIHGPIVAGECTPCHDPHGSKNFRLLPGPYPSAFYAPYTPGTYEACLTCHDKNLLAYAETTVYTKFRNGKDNLHSLHVSDRRKGRSCRACHEPHGSVIGKLIHVDGAQFGEWKVPIRFQQTATGGSCSPGCHQSYKYDREKPVINH